MELVELCIFKATYLPLLLLLIQFVMFVDFLSWVRGFLKKYLWFIYLLI